MKKYLIFAVPVLVAVWLFLMPVLKDETTPVEVEQPAIVETGIVVEDEAEKIPLWVEVTATYKTGWKDSWYAKAENYGFALRIGDRENWYYYNAFRNEAGGVSNDISLWLTGVTPGAEVESTPWRVPFGEIKLANRHDYGYHYGNFELQDDYIFSTTTTKDGDPFEVSWEYYY